MQEECIGCEKRKALHVITANVHGINFGLCDECFAIPEPRFEKTEKKLSKLTEVILYGKV